ncbi:MAG: hypothetical protein GY757_50075 [bacterium]|nr:hypothetical protein [bacterium]
MTACQMKSAVHLISFLSFLSTPSTLSFLSTPSTKSTHQKQSDFEKNNKSYIIKPLARCQARVNR